MKKIIRITVEIEGKTGKKLKKTGRMKREK